LITSLKDWERFRVEPGHPVRLRRLPTNATYYCANKDEAREMLKRYKTEIEQHARTLAAENKRSLLVILQGTDTSGKDGAIRKVFTGVNPQYCRVTSFKEPDREELDHDYLWRIYRALPAHGEIGVFNRSHYEDTLVLRARGQFSRHDARERMSQIASAERTWVENNIVTRKFFLHISRAEQTRRFQSRLDTPTKHWKVEESDFEDRKRWPHFLAAYEDAINHTAMPDAPWYIIPADHKWYRDVAIAGIVLATLRTMRPRLPMPKLNMKRLKL
jgi:PPK2 family polyphosphate:nucleotide phosphotransferase